MSVLLSDSPQHDKRLIRADVLDRLAMRFQFLRFRSLLHRPAPLTNVGRFMKMVESETVEHDPAKVRESLGYK
jgi:hypothetical protein